MLCRSIVTGELSIWKLLFVGVGRGREGPLATVPRYQEVTSALVSSFKHILPAGPLHPWRVVWPVLYGGGGRLLASQVGKKGFTLTYHCHTYQHGCTCPYHCCTCVL
jgi:hypothetical protein